MTQIFISYSKQDTEFAHHLRTLLQNEGFPIWMDEKLVSSEKWWRTIEANIKSCGAFIVIMSPRSYESDWVEREILVAEDKQDKKTIFPVLLEGRVWSRLANIQFEDMTEGLRATLRPAFVNKLEQYVPRSGNGPKRPGGVKPTAPKTTRVTPNVQPFTLPMLEWCDIPAGKVALGGIENQAFTVKAFRMAKYPVTQAQFQAFIDAPDGYCVTDWWSFSEASDMWRKSHQRAAKVVFEGDKQPREKVSWYEAMAFCRWLSDKTKLAITLPTETQWQHAAQGKAAREYPWGNKFDISKCNTSESRIQSTTPVDQYPLGASPFGVVDMAGNIWEWCLNTYNNPEDKNVDGTNDRVTRGGSWFDSPYDACTTYFYAWAPESRFNNIGFRVVASAVTR